MNQAKVIARYGREQAIEDGVLQTLWSYRWPSLTHGKPIVATAGVCAEISAAALVDVWNDYRRWRRDVMPTLPEADQLYSTEVNGRTVWVIEDGAAYTILYPEDY